MNYKFIKGYKSQYVNRIGGLLLASLCTFGFIDNTQAAQLDFGIIAPTTGTLSWAGASNPLFGSNIDVDNIVGLDTPENNNVISICGSCTLEFETGGSTGGWNFGAGGTISIFGTVDFPDGTTDINPAATLLTGTFNSAIVVDVGFGDFEFQIVGGSFTDTKHSALTDFYGLPGGDYVGGLNISFSTSANPGEAFTSSQIFSGDIVNEPVVPIPAAVWLFGSGLLGLVGIARRKKAA